MQMQEQLERGESMNLHRLKRTLQELNPGIHFDPAGKLGRSHPNISRWMGVYFDERHVGSVDRGVNGQIPEFNTYQMKNTPKNATPEIEFCVHLGWRTTLGKLAVSNIPGVTWPSMCLAFGIDYKRVRGRVKSLEVA